MSALSPMPDDVAKQIAALTLRRDRPLIICDADEVLFMFLAGLERFLNRRQLWLDMRSFALTGNIKHQDDNSPLDGAAVKDLLEEFFDSETAHLDPAPGAALALAELSREAEIVILSNIAMAHRDGRIAALAKHGMDYPLIANQGAKGPAVAALVGANKNPVVFIDDLPPNHQSVADHAPQVRRIHMIADHRLRGLIPAAKTAHVRHDEWDDAKRDIAGHFKSG